jgi:hypothetical protein
MTDDILVDKISRLVPALALSGVLDDRVAAARCMAIENIADAAKCVRDHEGLFAQCAVYERLPPQSQSRSGSPD